MTPPRLTFGKEGSGVTVTLNMTLIWLMFVAFVSALLWIGNTVATINGEVKNIDPLIAEVGLLTEQLTLQTERVRALEERGKERGLGLDRLDGRIRPLESDVRVLNNRLVDVLTAIDRMENSLNRHFNSVDGQRRTVFNTPPSLLGTGRPPVPPSELGQ